MSFAMQVLQIENSGHSLSIGRLDQFLYPYYQKDLQAGVLTREKALELVQNFFVMLSCNNKVRSADAAQFLRGNPLHQNITVGGQLPFTHEDATNELSYIC